MDRMADLVFVNGQVITVNPGNEVVQGLAVKNGRIAAVGGNGRIMSLIGAKTRVVDLKGRSLIPGIIDSHQHMVVHGTNEMGVNCRFPGVTSIEEIKGKIREAAAKTPPGRWIRGWGYDQSKLAEKRHPTRWDLDEAAPDHPVIIVRTCGHISANNSLSLKAAGITGDTPDPPGGVIEREGGRPNGVLKEAAHLKMLGGAAFTEEELLAAISLAGRQLASLGITSVHDSGGFGAAQMKALQEAVGRGLIKTRIYAMIFSLAGDNTAFVNQFMQSGLYTGFGNERLRVGCLKLMVDGSSSGPTAATRQPYDSNPEDSGILAMSREEVEDIFLRAHLAGFQVTAHAVGDRAVEMVLDAIEKSLAARPVDDHRHRIEHCAMTDPELIARIKKLGLVPVPQPVFLYEFGDGYLVNYGPSRLSRMFPCRTFIDQGIVAAASSDCPVTTPDPIFGMHLAVNRVTQGGRAISQEEKISILEAIRLYTINGAYASFEEGIKGSLEPGKLADLAVLSEPLLDTPAGRIREVRVQMTVIGGEVVYEEGLGIRG